MPITYSVDHEQGLLTAVAEGPVTLDGILQHLEQERVDQALPLKELIDATQVTLAPLTSADVREIVNRLRQIARQHTLGPTAVVVGDEVSYGVLRMLEVLVEDVCSVRPFRDRDGAARWLGSR